MRKTYLAATLALAAAAATAPVALAHNGEGHPGQGAKPEHPAAAKGPKGTHYLLQACVTGPATETAVDLGVLGGNHHMRVALDGATAFIAKLDEDTVIRLVGRARHLPKGSDPKRKERIGTFADLTAGDRVIVRFRAPRGTAATALPAAFRVVDRGPRAICAPSPTAPDKGDEGASPSL
jgi:hypothetical protein